MRLNWRQSSRSQDRLEELIAQQHKKRVLAGDVVPAGSCPDDDFIRMLARRSSRIALTDPRVDHAASCPKCMERLLTLRQEHHRRYRMWMIAGLITALLLVCAAAAFLSWYRINWHLPENH